MYAIRSYYAVQATLAVKLAEAMTEPLPEVDGGLSLQSLEPLRGICAGKTALAVGPGLA